MNAIILHTSTETSAEIESRLLAKHDEKQAISLSEAREWMVSLSTEEFGIVFDGISTRNRNK